MANPGKWIEEIIVEPEELPVPPKQIPQEEPLEIPA